MHLEHITTALNCLLPFGLKEDVLIYIDQNGLSFVRENNHVIRIQLLLLKELFLSFNFEPAVDPSNNEVVSQMKLCVKINDIIDSFNIMTRNMEDVVECTLLYEGEGSPFVFIFEDSFISERVEYSTYLTSGIDSTGLTIDRDQIILECIVKGDVLYGALRDLKEIGCTECYIYAKTSEDGDSIFAFIAKSRLGFSKIKLPSERSILEKLEIYENDSSTICHNVPVVGFFDFATFDKIRLSTKIASKVLMRMDVHGLLSVHILSQTDDIVISDARVSSNNRDRNDRFRQNRPRLPKDYPGTVIEVCMLEKQSIDEEAQGEIEVLMQLNEFGEDTKISGGHLRVKNVKPNYSRNQKLTNILNLSGVQEISNDRVLESSSLRSTEEGIHVAVSGNDDNDEEGDEEADQSNEPLLSANELPLFF